MAAVVRCFQTAECWELEALRSLSIALMNGVKTYLESKQRAAKLRTTAAETTQDTARLVQEWPRRAGLRRSDTMIELIDIVSKKWTQLSPEGQTVKNVISGLPKSTSAAISLYPGNIWGKQSWSRRTSCVRSSCSSPPCLCKKTFRRMEHFPSTLMSWLSKISLIFSVFFPPRRSAKLFSSLFSVTWT